MSGIILTAYDGAILGPIAKFLGVIMNYIYNGISYITGGRVESVVLSIIIITIIIYMCMLPLTIKQQKFSKLSQKMQPELQAVQAKYKNKKDQASMMAMQQETQLIYQKYGVSPMGTCLPLLFQFPILLALYRVFYNIPAYLGSVKSSFSGLTDAIMATDNYQHILQKLLEKFSFVTSSGINADNILSKFEKASNSEVSNYIVDILYKLPSKGWDAIAGNGFFPDLSSAVDTTHDHIEKFNYFLGLNISDTPWSIIMNNYKTSIVIALVALAIPFFSYLSQVANIKLMPQGSNGNDQMANQMKTMNKIMPLFSLVFCFITPVGLGIYWIFSALVRVVQQFFINRHFRDLDLDDIIKKNQEKAKKKREKRGMYENSIRDAANIKTKSLDNKANMSVSSGKEEDLNKANAIKSNAKPGSLAAKANMVKEFNERNSRK